MNDINSVVLVGRLTRDAERKAFSNSVKFTFSIAVNKSVKEGGNWTSRANYFEVEAWNCDFLKDYLLKGRQVSVKGELDSSEYTKDDRKIRKTFVRAENIQILGSFDKKESETPKAESVDAPKEEAPMLAEFDESDLPPF